jgi:DNA-directed RNA polymerase specialized sigma24 family protein
MRSPFSNDAELIEGLRLKNNTPAIKQLFKETSGIIATKCKILNNADRQSIVWDIFAIAVIKLVSQINKREQILTNNASLSTYFAAIAYNVNGDRIRDEKKGISVSDLNEDSMDNGKTEKIINYKEDLTLYSKGSQLDTKALDQKWLLEKIAINYSYLHEECESVLKLVSEGYEHSEIATMLNLASEVSSRNRLLKCRRELILKLQGQGINRYDYYISDETPIFQ